MRQSFYQIGQYMIPQAFGVGLTFWQISLSQPNFSKHTLGTAAGLAQIPSNA
jgi:hypothetical protein